ncbi:MAG TPA: DUF998 domain-containing protein [Actinomycetota bacterium]|nr:DUF998 domain-containing protein [Actinomycetota bacterium]
MTRPVVHGKGLWDKLVRREQGLQARPAPRLKTFTQRHPWLGPVVWMAAASYFVVQLGVAQAWNNPGYSWLNNSISDLGTTVCTHAICSPRHAWMNTEFFVLGLIMATGAVLIYQEFTDGEPEQRLRARIGFAAFVICGVGAMVVGAFPENLSRTMHIIGAIPGIAAGTVGIFILARALTLPEGLRVPMLAVPPVAIGAGILFAVHINLGIGAGTMERIAAYPASVWLIAFGAYIARTHSSRPRSAPADHRRR